MSEDKSLNKADLVAKLSENSGESKAAVERILDSLRETVFETVDKGGKVTLPSFISFEHAVKEAHTARNPQNGEEIKVPKKNVVRVVVSQVFKDRIAKKR